MPPMSTLRRIETPSQLALLRQLADAGAVLDTLLLQADAPGGHPIADGRQALLATRAWPGLPGADLGHWVERPCLDAQGQPISPQGELIDWLRFCGPMPRPYRVPAACGGLSHRWSLRLPENGGESGFFYALFMPPHDLRTPAGEAAITHMLKDWRTRYFGELLHVQHMADAQALRVVRWSTDWSNYFEPGHEWWGAFCWTLHDSRSGQITVIKAASTD